LALDPRARARATAPWLAAAALVALPMLEPLAAPDATALDALAAARRLAPLFTHLFAPAAAVDPLALESVAAMFDMGDGDAPYAGGQDDPDAPAAPRRGERLPEELLREFRVALDDTKTGDGSGASLSADELKRLIESGLLTDLAQGTGEDVD